MEEQMANSQAPDGIPEPCSLASPKKATENGSHFGGEGPGLPFDHNALSNFANINT